MDLLSLTTLTDYICGVSGVYPLRLLSLFDLELCIPFLTCFLGAFYLFRGV